MRLTKKFLNIANMEHKLGDNALEFDLMCIDAYGITYDFFNEVQLDPEEESQLSLFINKCKQGFVNTYTQRFQGSPKILERSDRKKVEEIDRLIAEAIEAAKRDDRETVKANIKKIKTFRI